MERVERVGTRVSVLGEVAGAVRVGFWRCVSLPAWCRKGGSRRESFRSRSADQARRLCFPRCTVAVQVAHFGGFVCSRCQALVAVVPCLPASLACLANLAVRACWTLTVLSFLADYHGARRLPPPYVPAGRLAAVFLAGTFIVRRREICAGNAINTT